jgi:hypothetical protein
MPLYGGIDLHANNSVIVVLNEQDEVIYRKRLSNDLPTILEQLAPYHTEMKGLVVESTYNWYWLVDGLMEADYRVHLANPAAMQQYSGRNTVGCTPHGCQGGCGHVCPPHHLATTPVLAPIGEVAASTWTLGSSRRRTPTLSRLPAQVKSVHTRRRWPHEARGSVDPRLRRDRHLHLRRAQVQASSTIPLWAWDDGPFPVAQERVVPAAHSGGCHHRAYAAGRPMSDTVSWR